MTNTTSAQDNTVTDTDATTENQAQARTYTQKEFDDNMARMKAAITEKATKPYKDLGDPAQLRQLIEEKAKRDLDEATKRGEFEKILTELATKKDSEISKRDAVIEQFKVEQPLLSAASEFRSVNPDQVKKLLRQSVRLNGEGEVEVLDDKGITRYNDKGVALTVKDLVKEFLDTNPHFVQPTVSTVNSTHSINTKTGGALDISTLDMKNPDHRKLYAQQKSKK